MESVSNCKRKRESAFDYPAKRMKYNPEQSLKFHGAKSIHEYFVVHNYEVPNA